MAMGAFAKTRLAVAKWQNQTQNAFDPSEWIRYIKNRANTAAADLLSANQEEIPLASGPCLSAFFQKRYRHFS